MLEQFAVSQVFAFLIVFTRVGSGIMVLPGFGEAYISPRIRLMLALMIALVLTPVLEPSLPALPGSPLKLSVMLVAEVMAGVFIGGICRILVGTLHIAGQIIAFQAGLSAATFFDINQGSQGTMLGNFLTLTAVVLMFTMDLHHLMLHALVDSYGLFPAGGWPPTEDFATLAATMVDKTFSVATRLSAPFIVAGLMLNLGAGVLSRVMPTMQVFFILMPAQILLSFFIFFATLGSIMLWYTRYFEETLGGFLSPVGG